MTPSATRTSTTCGARLRTAAVVALALGAVACGGASGGDPDATGGAGSDGSGAVSITGFKFVEADIEVDAGTEVTWTNEDTVAHTVEDSGDLFPESAELAKGETFSFVYESAGTYPYICGIHPYMKGTVTVS